MTQTHTLEREIDRTTASPVKHAGPPPASSGFFRGFRKWRNRAVVLLMVAAAAFGATQLIHHQSVRNTELKIDGVVLTSQPVDVETTRAGVITAVAVRAGDRVTVGQRVGSIDVPSTNTKGRAVILHQNLRATSDGILVGEPLSVGSTLRPGASFVEMYDPSDLQLVTTVPLSYLSKISPGMTADLTAPGVPGTVHVVLQRAVPRVGDNQATVPADSLQLVFTATNPATIATLIPGLRFTGRIDTDSVHGTRGRAQYVGSR